MRSSVPAMAIDLLRATEDDDLEQLQLLKETCATAFVGKSCAIKWSPVHEPTEIR